MGSITKLDKLQKNKPVAYIYSNVLYMKNLNDKSIYSIFTDTCIVVKQSENIGGEAWDRFSYYEDAIAIYPGDSIRLDF